MILIDTNILARLFLGDDPVLLEKSTALIGRAARGEEELFVPATVVSELSWLLKARRGISRRDIADAMQALFSIPAVHTEFPPAMKSALEHLSSRGGVSFVDCYHLALAKELGMTQVYSFDKKMDRYPGVERIEPE